MEGSFADAFNNHGAKKARWRGLTRQRIQSWLIATVQNFRVLVRKLVSRAAAAAAQTEVIAAVETGRFLNLASQIARWTFPFSGTPELWKNQVVGDFRGPTDWTITENAAWATRPSGGRGHTLCLDSPPHVGAYNLSLF